MPQNRPRNIEILTIGSELLLGSTVDTNGAWLGERLASAGFRVARRTTVGDVHADIITALSAALARSRCVICTGGLGPTPDDLTKDVVAALYGVPLELDAAWLAHVERRFRDRGIEMPAVNRNQAMLPRGAELLPNDHGTAPGLALYREELGATILLPGVPAEMRALFDGHVLRWLQARFGRPQPILSRTVRTTGIAESAVAERLAELEPRLAALSLSLAYLPTGIGLDLRVTSWGELEPARAAVALAEGERLLRERLGPFVYGREREDLAAILGDRLRTSGLTLAVAESCTGGLVAQRITEVPGSSGYFLGGVVAYANEAKQQLLGVAEATLHEHGAVSEAVAVALAEGVAARLGADCAIAVTGIAGPAGGTPEKPVGTVWIAVRSPTGEQAVQQRFVGNRAEIRARAAQAAMALLLSQLAQGE